MNPTRKIPPREPGEQEQRSQAAYFMSKLQISHEELLAAGAVCEGGVYRFPDGSGGRFMPFEGRFIVLDGD